MPLNRLSIALLIITTGIFVFSASWTLSTADEPAGKPTQGATVSSPQAQASKEETGVRQIEFSEAAGWKPCHFGGDGQQKFVDGVLRLGFGDPLTGCVSKANSPKQTMRSRLKPAA